MSEKELSFSIKLEGASKEATELAKLELGLKKITKERNDYVKLLQEVEKVGGKVNKSQIAEMASLNNAVKKQSDAYKSLKKVVDTSGDSLTRMRSKLADMKKEAANGSQELNTKMTPSIKKLTDEISKAEQAQGTFTRNVGNYGSAFTSLGDKIKDSFVALASGGAVIAAATALFSKLKEAIMSTSFAMDTMNIIGAVTSQVFYDIAINGKLSIDSIKTAIAVQDELNKLRVEQYEVDYKLSGIQRDINALMLEASDITKSDTERLEMYVKVRELDTEQTQIETDAIKERMKAAYELLKVRGDDEKLQKEVYTLATQLEAAYAKSDQAMRRVATQMSGIEKRRNTERENAHKKWIEEIERSNNFLEKGTKEYDDMVQAISDLIIKERELAEVKHLTTEEFNESAEAALKYVAATDLITEAEQKAMTENIKNKEETWAKLLEEGRVRAAEDTRNAQKSQDESDKKVLDREKEFADKKKEVALAGIQGVEAGADAVFESKRNRLQAEMEAELSKEDLTEKQKAEIKRKYAKSQQKIDVTQAIINGVLAISKTFASLGFVAGLIPAALMAAETAIEVATIKAQKFAHSGQVRNGVRVPADANGDNTLILAKPGEVILNERHQAMLGGASTFRKIGVPGFASSGVVGQVPGVSFGSGVMNRIKVPGYSNSGYIGMQPPEISSSNYQDLINAINSRFDRIEVVNDINKVRSAIRESETINASNRI